MVPFVPRDLPSLGRHRTLVSEGEYDPIVPRTNAEQLVSLFRKSGAEVTLRFERAGHELTSSDLNAAKQWLVDR
jgi:predicted esterase